MNKITDEDLILLFYGEHDNPALAAAVAESEELSQRFDTLCAELKMADAYRPPHRGSDYGADVWQRIAPHLAGGKEPVRVRLSGWLQALAQPRFSLAGALSLALVAGLAFMLGRQANQPGELAPPTMDTQTVAVTPGLDTGRLLTSSVSGHLEQLNLELTRFANEPGTTANGAERATDMLVANRLYRKAAADQGKHQLAQFLAELEPLLIELAFEAHKASPQTFSRMQQEVRDTLLFRVRVMNQQLKQPQIST